MDIKDCVGKEKWCKFTHWVHNELWYECENGFRFPVTTHDAGTATFNAVEKSVFLMRWIRKHLKTIEEAESL